MGGGASVLSSEDFVTMGQNLKEEYELLISAGHTDDEIRAKLMEKYNELFVSSDVALSDEIENVISEEVVETAPVTTGLKLGSANVVPKEKDMATCDSTLSLSGVQIVSAVPETTVGLTEKAKKARKRRGTFENDKVVTASKAQPVVIETLIEGEQ